MLHSSSIWSLRMRREIHLAPACAPAYVRGPQIVWLSGSGNRYPASEETTAPRLRPARCTPARIGPVRSMRQRGGSTCKTTIGRPPAGGYPCSAFTVHGWREIGFSLPGRTCHADLCTGRIFERPLAVAGWSRRARLRTIGAIVPTRVPTAPHEKHFARVTRPPRR